MFCLIREETLSEDRKVIFFLFVVKFSKMQVLSSLYFAVFSIFASLIKFGSTDAKS